MNRHSVVVGVSLGFKFKLSRTMPTKDKRTRILKSAVKVFAQKGFYHAKVSEIAKRAGVADGTIYLYFKNKDEILISIFEEELGKFIAEVQAEMAVEPDLIVKIRKYVHAHLRFVKKNPKLAQVFQLELRQSNRFIKEYTGSKLKEYLNLVGNLIEQGQREGLFRSDVHPGLAKRALFGALDEIATHWVLLKNGRYDLEESANQIADIFIGGLRKN
jgi:TetR/AcrR family fatty acid metabolism transcriptional regulator